MANTSTRLHKLNYRLYNLKQFSSVWDKKLHMSLVRIPLRTPSAVADKVVQEKERREATQHNSWQLDDRMIEN